MVEAGSRDQRIVQGLAFAPLEFGVLLSRPYATPLPKRYNEGRGRQDHKFPRKKIATWLLYRDIATRDVFCCALEPLLRFVPILSLVEQHRSKCYEEHTSTTY